jgi:uncharacterized protein (UPF0276 family)
VSGFPLGEEPEIKIVDCYHKYLVNKEWEHYRLVRECFFQIQPIIIEWDFDTANGCVERIVVQRLVIEVLRKG